MRSACLVDTTRCIGCRSCQIACKQSKDLGGEQTKFFSAPGGYQNPARFSPRTFTYVSYHELPAPGGEPLWVFVKRQCMHCTDLYCAQVCEPRVYHKTSSGVVGYRADRCIGCGVCIDACPFHVPTIDYWGLATPQVRKCTFCLERQAWEADAVKVDGQPLSPAAEKRYRQSRRTPACAKACPSGAIRFGDREPLLREAKRRIAAEPEKYVDHVYGETEAGGTGWLYLSRVPFEKLGFPTSFQNLDMYKKDHLGSNGGSRGALASFSSGLSGLLAAVCWFFKRRDEVRRVARASCPCSPSTGETPVPRAAACEDSLLPSGR